MVQVPFPKSVWGRDWSRLHLNGVNFVDIDIKRKANVVTNHFKIGVIHQMGDVGFAAREEIIDADDIVALI
jgi:hypothetical protein